MSIHFKTTIHTDLRARRMKIEIDNFIANLRYNDLVIFYFAGHGFQWEEDNFLVPADDFGSVSRNSVENNCISIQEMARRIRKTNPFAMIFILDCCRVYENPEMPEIRYRPGLRTIDLLGIDHICIAYACEPGKTASDSSKETKHGLYTDSLLCYITLPNTPIQEVFDLTGARVTKKCGRLQVPCYCSALHRNRDVCLYRNGRTRRMHVYQ